MIPCQPLHVYDVAAYPQRAVAAIERQITARVPRACFRPAGLRTKVWPIWLETRRQRLRRGGRGQPPAWHYYVFGDDGSPWPYGIVQVGTPTVTSERLTFIVRGMLSHPWCGDRLGRTA